MKGYELVFITDPGISEADLAVMLKKFKKDLKESCGKLIHEKFWGRRRLAYEIMGNDFGVYHVWYFTGSGKTVDELQRQFGYSDNILRNQIVKTNDLDEEASFLSKLMLPHEKSDGKNDLKKIPIETFEEKIEINEAKPEIVKDKVKTEEKIDT